MDKRNSQQKNKNKSGKKPQAGPTAVQEQTAPRDSGDATPWKKDGSPSKKK
jgi:hypothetical protein